MTLLGVTYTNNNTACVKLEPASAGLTPVSGTSSAELTPFGGVITIAIAPTDTSYRCSLGVALHVLN